MILFGSSFFIKKGLHFIFIGANITLDNFATRGTCRKNDLFF